jgi:maltooligosyltrehalose trehalohydrolase
MAEIKLKNGKAYCSQCGRDVEVREEKGDPNRDQKPFVLVDEHGHIIAERATRTTSDEFRLGAVRALDGSCEFTVWAPRVRRVEVTLIGENRRLELAPKARGYYQGIVPDIEPDMRYQYRLDGDKERADPASRYQPEGVFGPSQVVELSDFEWSDQHWCGWDLKDYILYELHVGAYTAAGTLDAITECLASLKTLGVTAIELMPVAQFSGARNWGYDGVFPFAVQNCYGGPRGLQRFVNACHQEGLAVILDVVYNHLGPEGNYLADFGPYFTDRYRTPWGQAINFDGAHSDEVIRFFIENALSWLGDFHVDALRLDAIHGIFDRSAQPFLPLLSSAVQAFSDRTKRNVYLIAESDLNDARFVTARNAGGYGLHAQWNDDFHHALHSLQTKEAFGYYRDFGSLWHMEKALQHGYVYTGEYSEYRQRRHGNSSSTIRPSQLVVFSQNHDQVGNRMLGERSSALLGLEAQKLSAGVVVLSPYLPLLFMGEEYGETAPFLYFTSHADPALGEAVREGRRAEFFAFYGSGNPPDPQAESTFLRSKLDHHLRRHGTHRILWDLYRELIVLRKESPALCEPDLSVSEVKGCVADACLSLRRMHERDQVFLIFNFGDRPADCGAEIPSGDWRKCLNSADTIWMGPGSAIPQEFSAGSTLNLTIEPRSFCMFRRASCAGSVSPSL